MRALRRANADLAVDLQTLTAKLRACEAKSDRRGNNLEDSRRPWRRLRPPQWRGRANGGDGGSGSGGSSGEDSALREDEGRSSRGGGSCVCGRTG